MIRMDEMVRLKNLIQQIENNSVIDDGTWLDHLNASQAFLVCIGAGPWKIGRRNFIQNGAIEALGDKDLSQIDDIKIFKYPLKWQNQKVADLIEYLKKYKITMKWFVEWISGMRDPVKVLYEITKTTGRAKVLDLFARDYLKAASFPIDRHVEKVLRDNDFPVNEKYMIELCQKTGLSVSHVARAFVSASGKFTGNGKIKVS